MNCLEFESQIEILARGTLADARTRAAAEAHGEACGACAARLADERSLSVGLRALAAGMKTAEAPAYVEAALLASFRARAASAVAGESSETAAGRVVVPLSGHAPMRRWSWAKTIAVASMAAAASLAFFVLVRPGAAPVESHEVASRPQQQGRMIEPPTVNPTPAARVAQAPDENEGVEPSHTPAEVRNTPRAAFMPRPRGTNVSYRSGGSRPAQAYAGRTEEVATDFIPLVQAGAYKQAEEGHLVRVELPRSALASFGLPVNVEAPSGRVKADVLMGQDGIARAIRFVR